MGGWPEAFNHLAGRFDVEYHILLSDRQCGTQAKNKAMENALNFAGITFDGLLVLTLLTLAWQLLQAVDLFKAIVLFVSFGLIMSLAWVRLQAVDIALAEAAIGAGLTGALFLAALGRLQRNGDNDCEEDNANMQSQEEKTKMTAEVSD